MSCASMSCAEIAVTHAKVNTRSNNLTQSSPLKVNYAREHILTPLKLQHLGDDATKIEENNKTVEKPAFRLRRPGLMPIGS